MKFKLKGDPNRGGEVSASIHYGYDFSGGAVEVKEADIIEKLRNHSHFEVINEVKIEAPKSPKPRKKAVKKAKKVDYANEDRVIDSDTQENRGS